MKLSKKVWKLGQVTARSPAILLVHGNKFCKEIWLPIVEQLSRLCAIAGQSAEVIAVDLPGCGDSRPIDFDLPADWHAQCVPGILQVVAEHRGSGRPLFAAGHSIGGAMVMACEAERPGTFTRILGFEPIIYARGTTQPSTLTDDQRQNLNDFDLARAVRNQTRVFTSREEAFRCVRRMQQFQLIPDDVIWVYVQHGLEDVPGKPGHVGLKQDPAVEADRFLGLHLLTEEDVEPMRAPCAFVYGSKSDWGLWMAGTDIQEWVNHLAGKFSKGLAPPWEVAGATHLVPFENIERAACDIQRLVWYETASADANVQSKL